MNDLAVLLATLYSSPDRIRYFLRRVGIDPAEIHLEDAPARAWERALEAAWRRKRVDAVVGAAAAEFPESAADLRELQRRFLADRRLAAGARSSRKPRVSDPTPARFVLDRLAPDLHRFLTRCGLWSDPPERAVVVDYLRGLAARIAHGPNKQKEYVPLVATTVAAAPEDEEVGDDPFLLPVHQVIRELEGVVRGGDSASAQIAAVNRKSRIVRNILRRLGRAERPLVLLGEPGSGKTMTLQQAALALADGDARRIYPRVAVYIRLGEFHVAGRKPDESDVREFVRRSVPESIRRLLEPLAYRGRLVIFFDGMDEMSRERYGEHTEALSRFAGSTLAKTLFSCRVTDFNPEFVHRRLVLLPFDRRQVSRYLGLYVRKGFPLAIDGGRWWRKELAERIARGGLPIEATNPFVLWLLCIYLQGKATWPESRVKLLAFYNARNYELKARQVPDGEPALPAMDDAFRAWARFAFQITERNLGTSIPVRELEAGEDPEVVRAMIRAGKVCGIILRSIDRFEDQVRFDHHRLQEYFCAWHIHAARPPISWLEKLDAPRWQETMLNVILMGGVPDVLAALADSIASLTRAGRGAIAQIEAENDLRAKIREHLNGKLKEAAKKGAEEVPGKFVVQILNKGAEGSPGEVVEVREVLVEKRTGGAGEGPQAGKVVAAMPSLEPLPIELAHADELVLADRVELGSRVLRQAGAGATEVREALMGPFRDAVAFLAERGNPITQVKVLRACQNVPGEIVYIEALKRPLNSPVAWVRNQALILMASGDASARLFGRDLATEIGYDLANDVFQSRLPAYLRAVRSADAAGHRRALLAGLACLVARFALLALAAAALHAVAYSLRGLDLDLGRYSHRVEFTSWRSLIRPEEWDIDPALKVALDPGLSGPGDLGFFAALGRPGCRLVAWVSVIATVCLALRYRPGLALPAGLAAAVWSAPLILFLIDLWNGRWRGGVMFWEFAVAFGTVGLVAAATIAPAIELGTLSAYLAATRASRQAGHTRSTFAAAWSGALKGFAEFVGGLCVLEFILALGWLLLIYLGGGLFFGLVFYVLMPSVQYLSDISRLPLGPIGNAIILAVAGGLLIALARTLRRHGLRAAATHLGRSLKGLPPGAIRLARRAWARLRGAPRRLVENFPVLIRETFKMLLYILLILAASLGSSGLLIGCAWLCSHYFPAGLEPLLPVAARIVAAFIIVAYVAYIGWSVSLPIRRVFGGAFRRWPGGFPARSYEPGEWRQLVKSAGPERQREFLLQTNHQALGLKPAQFLEVLMDLAPTITREPALSAYWERRDRIEQILKQERQD